MKLEHKISGEGKPLIILHGLFGSLDNWQTHARKLSEYFKVILVDQRNHGHSPWSDEFDYTLMADDLLELMNDLGIEKAYLLGHSMGGKTVMQFTEKYPEKVEKLIVADIGFKQYPLHHQQIIAGMDAISATERNSRSAAEKLLSEYVPEAGTRQFIMKNLYWVDKTQLGWRFNLEVLKREMPNILGEIELTENWVPTLFIRGEKSNYIVDSDLESIEEKYPDMQLVTIENAGHWVHAEAPDVFMNAVLEFLLR
jgi:pimeloyl-ACP methyl ester carboxylesterase